LLLVPSLINRWYVLDLREGHSLVRALLDAGVDAYCLDWGVPEDEDRFLTWEDVVHRLGHAVNAVRRFAGAKQIGLLGYCMGGTLASIYAALNPQKVGSLVNLLGPIDFSKGGLLTTMVDRRYFDADAVAEAGNVSALQMQSGFAAMRPTGPLAKWVNLLDHAGDPAFLEGFAALETWANDNVAFPGAAYATYIRDLYQENHLVRGDHFVGGRRVDLSRITCPVATVVAEKDTICPPAAATALNDLCGSSDKRVITVPGGHVGAVVGNRAAKDLYPQLSSWLTPRLAIEDSKFDSASR
jgi:polyhydroxyalkanoate synthase